MLQFLKLITSFNITFISIAFTNDHIPDTSFAPLKSNT